MQPMVVRRNAQELILGMNRDPIFGPAILFGAGGVAVEVMDDTAIALPPLDEMLAGDLIGRTRIGRLLAGFRDCKPPDRKAIAAALNGLSQMIVDFPCIVYRSISIRCSPMPRASSHSTPASRSIQTPSDRLVQGSIEPECTAATDPHEDRILQISPIISSAPGIARDGIPRVEGIDWAVGQGDERPSRSPQPHRLGTLLRCKMPRNSRPGADP